MATKKIPMLGSEIEIHLENADDLSSPIIEEAEELGLMLQKIFNFYDPKSELSTLNHKGRINPSDELLEVMILALQLCRESKGEYDISLGRLILRRKEGKEVPIQNCSYKDIHLTSTEIVLANENVQIDLGSIAKGYIGEKIAKFIFEAGIESGYVDVRGDIRVFGNECQVAIANPRGEGTILRIAVKNKGIATSGDYMQYHGDYSNSHVLNKKDIASATVVADTLFEADAYATIMMVCDKKTREEIITKAGHPAMTIDINLNKQYFNGFEELIVHEN